jgi:hypothetical protein
VLRRRLRAVVAAAVVGHDESVERIVGEHRDLQFAF